MNNYLIAAGGTGGHFYPGIALGKELISRGERVIFIVRKNSPNIKYLDEQELSYQEVNFMGMPRKNILKWFSFIYQLIKTIKQMRQLIKDTEPKFCIGMGGYISFPLIFTAHFMGYKTAIHDSNTRIGFANKICAKFVDIFFLGLPVDKMPKKALLIGTPVREEFQSRACKEEKIFWEMQTDFAINLLIFGGSQGARRLNFAVVEASKKILALTKGRLHILHITGTRDYEEIKTLYGDTKNLELLPYSEDIYSLMKVSNLIIARSGASSLAEITCLKKPSILVPFPYATDNHQYYNAKVMEGYGVSTLITESDNLAEDLFKEIKRLLSTPKVLQEMTSNFNKINLPSPLDSAKNMANILQK